MGLQIIKFLDDYYKKKYIKLIKWFTWLYLALIKLYYSDKWSPILFIAESFLNFNVNLNTKNILKELIA